MPTRSDVRALAVALAVCLPLSAPRPAAAQSTGHDHGSASEHGDWSWDDWKSAFADFFVGPETKEEFRWQGKLATGATLEIKGVNGWVDATPAGGDTIELVAVKHGRRSDPKRVEIAVVEHPGGITICAVYPTPEGSPANECRPGEGGRMKVRHNDVAVDFTLKLPAGIELAARTVNGAVKARDIAAAVRARTVNGSIHVAGAAGDVEAQTVNGAVRLDSRGTARAETVNGSIAADLGRADWSGRLDLETVNGSVTVSLPADASTDLNVTTTNGRIRNGFELTRTERATRRELRGTIGKGGRELRISTVNGGVRIQPHAAAEAPAAE